MATPLITPPFGAQPFDIKTNRFTEQWQRWFLALVNQIASAFAPVDGGYVVTGDVPGLTNQFNLGLLSNGILKQTVAAGIATPSIAVAGTDYTALAFKTIQVATQSDVVADSPADTLTLAAGAGVTITTNASTDTVTIAASGTGTVTTTGSPSSGDMTKFSGATSITNAVAGTDYTALAFKTITVSGQSDVVADTPADTLTLVGGTGVTITTNAGTDTVTFSASAAATGSITLTIDGQGVVITTGIKGYKYIPRACTIIAATIYSDNASPVTGSIVFDVWRDVQANYPPTVADTITASDKPTLTSGIFSQDTTLTGWSASLAVGDFLGFNVDSVSSLTKVVLELSVQY